MTSAEVIANLLDGTSITLNKNLIVSRGLSGETYSYVLTTGDIILATNKIEF